MTNQDNTHRYDVIVWGASGFTGKWVAKHLFDTYGPFIKPKKNITPLRWAIAGRNADKLAEVSRFIGDANNNVDCVLADSDDEDSLREMVSNTNAIISTVGPYAFYGSLLVKVCAEEGTHYVDLTGEVPWMREMIDAHHETAKLSGAKIVHSCGFDSVPSDMGVHYAQKQARKKFGKPLKSLSYKLMDVKGGISGGTIASMMNIIEQAVKDKKTRKLLGNPYALNPDKSFRGPDKGDQTSAKFCSELQQWTAPFMMAGINTRIVRRTNALMNFAYGKDFNYSEVMVTGKGAKGYIKAKTIAAGMKAMVLTSFTPIGRKFMGLVLPSQGEGPKVDPENPGFYHIQFNGHTEKGDSLIVHLRANGDPGYGSTSKMLAEAAVCLAMDDVNIGGGFWTPASALGDLYLERLQANAGITFEKKYQ